MTQGTFEYSFSICGDFVDGEPVEKAIIHTSHASYKPSFLMRVRMAYKVLVNDGDTVMIYKEFE